MKLTLFRVFCLICLLPLQGCGKKTEKSNTPPVESKVAPTEGELNFKALADLKRSIQSNDVKTLREVFRNNPQIDLNMLLQDGNTLLISAIKLNHIETRNFLLDKGANPNLASVNQETPLMAAVMVGSINSTRVLLDLGVEINRRDKDGHNALHFAISQGHEEIALILIKDGIDYDRSSIELAERQGLMEVVELIKSIMQIEYGSPDMKSFRNVILAGDLKGLRQILTRYPRLATDYEMINPLALSMDIQNEVSAFGIAQLFLNSGVNPDGPKKADIPPLIKAVKIQKKEFINLLLHNGANPLILDDEGKSALIHAIEKNDLEIVTILLGQSVFESYSTRKACAVAKDVGSKLKTDKEKSINKSIIKKLNGCGFWGFLSQLENRD